MSYEEEKQDRKIEQLEAEIERLRAELARANVELMAAGELVTQLKRVREAEIDQAGAAERIYLEAARLKDARIKELEDVLAEYQRLGKIMEGRLPCLTLHGECERCSSRAKEVCDAMHQIAEGKIGPEDAKPRSWQITEERIATIAASLKVLERLKKVNTNTDNCYLDAGIAVLRTMLEASQ